MMTGMPAFGKPCRDKELWHIAIVVRHLRESMDAERETLEVVWRITMNSG